MKCAWQELIHILPFDLGKEVDIHQCTLQELRLRLGQPPELICADGVRWLQQTVSEKDLSFCVNAACRYSPWTAESASMGYITAPGGHRIGLCGEAVVQGGIMTGIRRPSSINIRIARDFPGIAADAEKLKGSILILGPPGSGKTTLLRDLSRQYAERETVAVVDERGELFPVGMTRGKRMDVLQGCKKSEGVEIVLRTMGPERIAVDEITAQEDCLALLQSGWCGVKLLATAHAASVKDLRKRKLYRPILEMQLFDHILVLNREKSWQLERMES